MRAASCREIPLRPSSMARDCDLAAHPRCLLHSGGAARAAWPAVLVAILMLSARSSGAQTWSPKSSSDPSDPVSEERNLPPESSTRPEAEALRFAVRVGGASSSFAENEVDVATFGTGLMDFDASVGWFVTDALRLGVTASVGLRQVLGRLSVDEPRGDFTGVITGRGIFILPLGGFIELQPASLGGLFFGLHASGGVFSPPEFMRSGNLSVAGWAALEVGHEPIIAPSMRLGFFSRYAASGARLFYIDEAYNDTLTSHELSLGARVTIW